MRAVWAASIFNKYGFELAVVIVEIIALLIVALTLLALFGPGSRGVRAAGNNPSHRRVIKLAALPAQTPGLLRPTSVEPAELYITVTELSAPETNSNPDQTGPNISQNTWPASSPSVPDTPLIGWPVRGALTQGFGCSTHYTGIPGPDCAVDRPWFHDGLDIGAWAGASVRATLSGTVIMTYNRNNNLASPRNGILGQVHRYLNTLGSWNSYRDLSRPEDIPKRLTEITAAYFGVVGLERGLPKLTGILGAIMAVHALEQVTGASVTFGVRWLVRGETLGQYRGVILRQSPFTPRAARALGWLIGSRLVEADGYYFFESGRTWHSQRLTVQIWDTTKTLTHVRGFSLPYREYYFDREIPPQTVVDIVKGDRAPHTTPGFIGSVNELENATSLGYIKRAFFAANWLLIDEGERDDGGPGYVDYDALVKGNTPRGGGLSGGSAYHPFSPAPSSGPGGHRPGPYGRQGNFWPSTISQVTVPAAGLNRATVATANNGPSRPLREPVTKPASTHSPPPPDEPYLRIKARYQAPDGRLYPLLIQSLTTNPVTMVKKVDAIYYDGATQRWQEITDEATRMALAREVEAGNLKVTADWQHYL